MLKADGAKFLGLRSIESTTELSAAKLKKTIIFKNISELVGKRAGKHTTQIWATQMAF